VPTRAKMTSPLPKSWSENRSGRSFDPVHIAGISTTSWLPEQNAVVDELVYDAVSQALSSASLNRHEIGLTVTASMDLFDGRSISSGLTNSASGGYLKDSYRLESDVGTAIIAAAQAISAGDVDVAVAVGAYNPETSAAGRERHSFLEQLSNFAFDAHFARPIGLTARSSYGLHASWAMSEQETTLELLAELAAREINIAFSSPRSMRRSAVTASEVLASLQVSYPLTELMLPAYSTGAAAVVLASPARAARANSRGAIITGVGHSTSSYLENTEWLRDPGASTARAAAAAYRTAGLLDPAAVIRLVEFTAPSIALYQPLLDALGLDKNLPHENVNPSGGAAANYPGLANGALRLLEVVERLEDRPALEAGVVHSVDTITGTAALDSTVLVVEGA
jgi:acetyl-CoA acetyltransferase